MRDFTDAEDYEEGMEHIDPGLMTGVLERASAYDSDDYSERDVLGVLSSDGIGPKGFAALLSPAAEPFLEKIARRAKEETMKHFGNSVNIFTPLYASNYCSNRCVYCGFNRENNIKRAKLVGEEIDREMEAIASTGLREILLLTGESRLHSDPDYIADLVARASGHFSNIGLEVYPMNTGEYRRMHEMGADYVTVFQETYDTDVYKKVHPGGRKRIFSYRFNSQERALRGGMRGVGFAPLLGLSDFRRDSFACGLHAMEIQRKYPHAEISFSLPRFRPFINHEDAENGVTESKLLQVAMAYRLFMPFAGQTISTRERPGFRDNIVGICATKMSAGVSVGIGEHSGTEKGDAQFDISDPRGLEEVVNALVANGRQPVFNDYVKV
ncbi:MAG: 2-iminoacetate synthase ThiH [Gammaproteobacteria bacterium]|jgi:2-iminoacetate synthase|nr:2-iminoacetate synthase ThiH [Gammaproteobacteria bacterium]